MLEEVRPEQREVESFEVIQDFPRVGRRIVSVNAGKVYGLGNHFEHILMTFSDVTDVREE